MIDITHKQETYRFAEAYGEIFLNPDSLNSIKSKTNPKGDVLENAKLSAIHAVKKTPEFVFMCHPIRINAVNVNFKVHTDHVSVIVQVSALEKTGVEIEAVAGVFNSLLAIFDLCKRYEKDEMGNYPNAKITEIKVLKKTKKYVKDM